MSVLTRAFRVLKLLVCVFVYFQVLNWTLPQLAEATDQFGRFCRGASTDLRGSPGGRGQHNVDDCIEDNKTRVLASAVGAYQNLEERGAGFTHVHSGGGSDAGERQSPAAAAADEQEDDEQRDEEAEQQSAHDGEHDEAPLRHHLPTTTETSERAAGSTTKL